MFFKNMKRESNKSKAEKVKVVGSYKDVVKGEIFRLKKDEPNVIRFFPENPEGFVRYGQGIGTGDKVTGTTYSEEICLKFIEGHNRTVDVEYAPSKEFPEAIKVMGIWNDDEGQHREHIGYLEADLAKEIYNEYENLPITATLSIIYKPVKTNKNLGIRIFLLCASRPKRFKKND